MAVEIQAVGLKINGIDLTVNLTPPVLPEPVLDPMGWRVYPGDRQMPARVKHDAVMRDTPLQQTNEMFPLRPHDGYKADWRSKITMKLAQRPVWVDRFIGFMGSWVWGRFNDKGFGWMDFAAPNESLSFNALDCGGNLRNILEVIDGWGLVQTLDFGSNPYIYHTYENAPHLCIKQVLVGRSTLYNPYWVVDKGERGGVGDLVIPCVTDTLAAHPLSQLEFFPALPFAARLSGVPVVVEGYSFSGSDVYVLCSGQWYCAEEMLVLGKESDRSLGGSWLDRRTYIVTDGWPTTCPPPVIGWTRQG